MRNISSYPLRLRTQPEITELLALSEFAERSDINIYLYRKESIVTVTDIPKVLSFFIFSTMPNDFLVIIEGVHSEDIVERVKALLGQLNMQLV